MASDEYAWGFQDGLAECSGRLEAITESIVAYQYGELTATTALERIGAVCGYFPEKSE